MLMKPQKRKYRRYGMAPAIAWVVKEYTSRERDQGGKLDHAFLCALDNLVMAWMHEVFQRNPSRRFTEAVRAMHELQDQQGKDLDEPDLDGTARDRGNELFPQSQPGERVSSVVDRRV